jgi:hypothetical protein
MFRPSYKISISDTVAITRSSAAEFIEGTVSRAENFVFPPFALIDFKKFWLASFNNIFFDVILTNPSS